MAGSDARRIVLLYGPSGDGWADRVLKALPSRWCRTFEICDGSGSVPTRLARLAALRLQGETLLASETRVDCIAPLAGCLRDSGVREFFVLNPEFRPHDESEMAWQGPANLRRRTILSRVRERKVALDAAHAGLSEAAGAGRPVTEAARWVLDNAWLIQAGINQLQKNLPPNVSQPDSARRKSDICGLAQNLAVTADFAVDADNIEAYLQEIQKSHELTTAELWAFSSFLRAALIEGLARKATCENEAQQLDERALLWANRLTASMRAGQDAYTRLLELLEHEPIAYRRDFPAMLAERLLDNEPALTGLRKWAEERFGISLSDLERLEQTNKSARALLISNAYKSLRSLGHLDFAPIFESVSVVEAELRTDPGGIYPRSNFETRDRCRREVERISLQSGMSEQDVARCAVTLAHQSNDARTAHVAWYLLSDGVADVENIAGARVSRALRIRRWAIGSATAVYITAILLLTGCFMAISVMLAREAGVHSWTILAAFAAVASFTLSELSVEIAHALIISLLPPEPLPRMDYRDGIPADKATLVVVPTMLTSRDAIRREIGKLEVRYLGNRNENIFFALLSDFTDSPVAVDAEDDGLLRTAVQGINRLNARYDRRFLLFHRPRTWSDSEQAWIGRERKRGKIEDLNAFLLGENSNLLYAGRLDVPVSYVITLDSDTQLPTDTAQKLIETIAHPLNRVVVDPVTRARTSGYAIIQPRISIALPGATATRFTRIFADAHGTDPYSRTVSDAQQELFLEGIFHGKAIYDVSAFHRILQNRFPAETVLSHDLIEGSHTGVGLASDIELFENMPLDYGSYAARQRRWIRGDWQIAPWIFRRVPLAAGGMGPTPLSIISRWRILDNLRRSLVPVAAVALLLFGWLISSAPAIASLVVGLALVIPAFAPLLDRLARRVHGSVRGWQGAADDLKRAAVMIAFLPHQAWLALDSIARVFYRRWISHRRMLEWQTAEKVRILGGQHLDAALRQMAVISALAIALEFFLALKGVWTPDVFFVALWIAAPLVMPWLAGPGQPEQKPLGRDEKLFLRRTARRTWRYFDDHVTAATNWLPPDNSQLKFQIEVAPRTSPTNIGLWLTASLTALDFGYQTAAEMCGRCARTMETVQRLDRSDTNLLNWYDTRTLAPLSPWYVSTVDSGNLVVALWVFARGCLDTLRAPLIGRRALRGLSDTLAVVEEACGNDRPADTLRELSEVLQAPEGGYGLLARLSRAAALCATHSWGGVSGDEARYWTLRLKAQVMAWNEMATRYLAWMHTLAAPSDSVLQEAGPEIVGLRRAALARIPSLKTMARGGLASLDALLAQRQVSAQPPEIADWLDRVAAEYAVAQSNAAELAARLRSLRTAAETLSRSMDLGRFYDRARKLFGIGYSARDAKVFTSHYDLLASECRLTSLAAIAKGDVPVEHWFAMSRPWDHARHHGVLLSWSGTMFEYLMPLLFTRPVANSLLHQACLRAVNCQIEYARQKRIPWGISESAHSVRDARQIYQYRAFGMPELALNPEIGEELVVAPYATMLALSVAPEEAVTNLHQLAEIGMSGPMGFYESVDFRSEREGNTGGEVVRCYMAHHQAMTLAALDNVLHGNAMQRRFHRDPRIRSVEALLCERVPIMPLPGAERTLRHATERLVAGFHLNEERFATSAAVSN